MAEQGKKTIFLFLLVAFMSPVGLLAFQLSPLDADFTTTGNGAARIYSISNDTDSTIAVVVGVNKRNINADGSESSVDGGAYFSIQPAKMIIPPGRSQLVRISYRGPKILLSEMAFHFVFEQVPYNVGIKDEGEGPLSVLIVFTTTSFVAPAKVVEKVEAHASRTGCDKLTIRLENAGNVHQMLYSLSISVYGDDGSCYRLSDAELNDWQGRSIYSSTVLEKTIDMPLELDGAGSFSVEVSYDYEYGLL